MQKKNIDLADCVSVLLNGAYTVMIYYSNTPMGTKGQADLVAYYTAFMLAITIVFMFYDDALIMRANDRHPIVKAFSTTTAIVQAALFMFTTHFALLVMRVATFLLMYTRYRVALERTSKATTHS